MALCTYNGGTFLRQQLDSIVNQTRRPDEIVVCDDGSTDRSLVVIQEASARHPEIDWRIKKNPVNIGYVRNFEQALGACTGDFIFLADQDDVWLPDKVEILSAVLRQQEDVLAVFSDAETIDQFGAPRGVSLWEEFSTREYLARDPDPFACLLRRSVATGATMAFHRRLKPFILPFPRFWVHDEWIALQGSYFGRVLPIEHRLVRYRRHDNNAVGLPLQHPKGLLVRLRAWLSLVWPPEKCYQVRQEQAQRFRELMEHLDRHRTVCLHPARYARALEFTEFWTRDTSRLPVPRKLWYLLSNTANGRFFFHYENWKGAIVELLASLCHTAGRCLAAGDQLRSLPSVPGSARSEGGDNAPSSHRGT